MPETWTIKARWLVPIDAPPIEGGTLTIAGEHIVAVDPPGRRRPDLDLGNVAVLPGLVNAHTHLDLGNLRPRLPPPTGFTQWLQAVVAYRRNSSPTEWEAAVRAGMEECLLNGTTLVGDISNGGLSGPILTASPLRAVVFYELIGLSKLRARQAWKDAHAWLQQQRPTATYRPGLSPHAPYSVRRSLFRLAVRPKVPLAIHLAETPLEEELLRTHRGPLRDFLEELGAWDEEGLAESLSWIVSLYRQAKLVLYVHGNYLDQVAGIHELPWHNARVVYCPRTHAYFGHPLHPLVHLRRCSSQQDDPRGPSLPQINVALGTDSLASSPDLSILEEMRFLWRRYPGWAGADLVQMGTLAGATALGWDQEVGSLTPGKSADWIAVPLENAAGADPYRLLLESPHSVREVCIRGQWLVREGKLSSP